MQDLQSSALSMIKGIGIRVCVNEKGRSGWAVVGVVLQLIKDAREKADFGGAGVEVPQP